MSENKNDCIRKSIDNIEPAAGARERMLENIRRKAAEQTADTVQEVPQKSKVLSINKFLKWAMPIAACFVIAVVGFTYILPLFNQTTPSESVVQNPNPFMTVYSANEIETVLGFSIDAPQGAENVEYSIRDGSMASIAFEYEEHFYIFCASKQNGDFSGLYGDKIAEEQIDSQTSALLETVRNGETDCYKLTWTDGKVTYILTNTDGAAVNDMKAIYSSVK